MGAKIQILPEQISQAIAAGEVIERPASVVKELMENAIDAGSSEIIVELETGGLQRICICDNGEGMDREDAPLALRRYATSKIRKVEDLYAIHTLGFRGEALPSIASVSQMTMKTRVSHSMSGTKVVCEGGEIKSISEVGCPIGTEVEVKNIFYNLPARRKFLKSIRSELRYALNHFFRLSLFHPTISFKFIHDGRMLHEFLRTESPMVRIEAVLGRDVYDHLRPFEFENGEVRISGFASLPTFSKGSADGIYIYVNQRFVKDRIVTKAILEAYRHVIPSGKFPIVLLWITLPPYAVDVNVHPTKAEIKFRNPERVFQAVIGTLSSLYERRDLLEQPFQGEGEGVPYKAVKDSLPSVKPKSYAIPFPGMKSGEEDVALVREPLIPEWKAEEKIPFRILGQIQETYILCEGEKGLIIIDQHAAHERILFETYKKKYETESVPCLRFLIPHLVELSVEESFNLMSHLEDFQKIGFEIDPMGEKVYAIRSIPSWVDQKDPKEMVRTILDELPFLEREKKGAETIHTILVTLACHSAIRGNFMLRREEMEELVRSLSPYGLSTTCPHGRPVFFVVSREELAKEFKRKSSF